jgi:S1-C subfamily serine protease
MLPRTFAEDMNGESGSTPEGRSRRWFLSALGAAAAVGVAGCSSTPTTNAADDPTPTVGVGDRDGEPIGETVTPEGGVSPYTEVYRETISSVVLLQVSTSTGTGQGSGFMWDGNHVVTNQHVVEDANGIEVRFDEGEWREGSVVGTDVYSDLAVVRVEDVPDYATPLEVVGGDPPIGTEVVALGNPLGLGQSISSGIVSGLDRTLPSSTGFSIPDAIQTDAAANPGNSGGPLVMLDGRVAGVISAGQGDNIAFAISGALTNRVVPALIEDGEYGHAYMGIGLRPVTPTLAEANDLPAVRGVMVVSVVEDGPSDGVLQGASGGRFVDGVEVPVGGDVVLAMDGFAIPDSAALSAYLALEASPGDTIPVEVLREGQRRTVELTLGRRPIQF